MATVYISEFTTTIVDHGRGGGAAQQPPVAQQTVAIGAGSVQSNAFNTNTRLIRVHTDAIMSFEIGPNPTASATDARMAANQTEYFGVSPGDKIAIITNS